MAELKTGPTRKRAKKFVNTVEHRQRREDALALLALFSRVTTERPVMWGDSIIGFGRYYYQQRSGQAAMWPITGFSPRKQNLVLYIMPGFDSYADTLARLGKFKTARSCLYINKLADIEIDVLEELIITAVADMRERHDCD